MSGVVNSPRNSSSSVMSVVDVMNDMADASAIKVMVISESGQQRTAFSETLAKLGFNCVDCINSEEIDDIHLDMNIGLWLVDSQYDENLHQKLSGTEQSLVLMGFETAPSFSETKSYAKWQRKLKRKLAMLVNIPKLSVSQVNQTKLKHWHFVIFLAVPSNQCKQLSDVKSFLDKLPASLPVTILLATHADSDVVNALPMSLTQNNSWRCQVISTSQSMQTGQCLVAPVGAKIVCDSTGRVIFTEQQSGDLPNIGAMLKNLSDVFNEQLISIVFSGKQESYLDDVAKTQENNSQLWVQSEKNSETEYQSFSKAIIDAGLAQFVGTPQQLAIRVKNKLENQLQLDNMEHI